MSTVESSAGPDFTSPEVGHCPYPFYAAAREQAGAYRVPALGSYLVTRFDDVITAARDYPSFTSRRSALAAGDPEFEELRAKGYPAVPALVTCDPPDHSRYRKLVQKSFTPGASSRHEPLIRQIITELLDDVLDVGRIELMSQFAIPLPARVTGGILGVPPDTMGSFGGWADNIAEVTSGYIPRERALECTRGIVEMQLFFADLIEERRNRPGDDLVSAMVTARESDERPLDVPEILELIRIFVAGGTESTASWLGSALYSLLLHPEQFERVRAEPALIPQMLEEVLRFESPVQWNPRVVATENAAIGGVPIPHGVRIMLSWAAANRDPDKYGPNADTFDIFRDGPVHAAFGHANHFCLGAPLARLEARIACEQLFTRLPDLEFAVPVQELTFVNHGNVRRLESLPLKFSTSSA